MTLPLLCAPGCPCRRHGGLGLAPSDGPCGPFSHDDLTAALDTAEGAAWVPAVLVVALVEQLAAEGEIRAAMARAAETIIGERDALRAAADRLDRAYEDADHVPAAVQVVLDARRR